MRVTIVAWALALAASTAYAERPPEPQVHEVTLDIDISIENQANGSNLDATYLFTPSALNRVDVVHPFLRRFVHHPSSLLAHVHRTGISDGSSQTSAGLGGVAQFLDGALYFSGELGLEIDTIGTANEDGYYSLPVHLELGARPAPLFSVGAFWDAHPIINATRDDSAPMGQAQRSGIDQSFGGTITLATANDGLILTVSGEYRMADWDFTTFHFGTTTVRGLGAHIRAGFQLSPAFTFQARFDGYRDHWVDDRDGDEAVNWVGTNLDRTVYRVSGALDVIYWLKGRLGFRFTLGGGYTGAPGIYAARTHGAGRFGFGLVVRF